MDDQNEPTNQQPNEPVKKPDVTSSAPVEMEPETQPSMTPPTSQTAGSVSSTPAPAVVTPAATPDPLDMPNVVPPAPTEPALPAPDQPDGLLEAPKKKSTAFMAVIVVVLVIALAALGYMVYKMIY